jgi:hypothetical protein
MGFLLRLSRTSLWQPGLRETNGFAARPLRTTKIDRRTMNKKKHKTHILILDGDDPEKELDFEIEFQLSLTPAERYEIMDKLVRDGLEFVKKPGYKKTPAIVAR